MCVQEQRQAEIWTPAGGAELADRLSRVSDAEGSDGVDLPWSADGLGASCRAMLEKAVRAAELNVREHELLMELVRVCV